MVVVDRYAAHAGEGFEDRRINRFIEVEVDRSDCLGTQLGNILDGDEFAVPNDADPIGDTLHLGQGVAGQEDRAPVGSDLTHHRLELPLNQRIETGAGFVHDQQIRPVHERLDQADLLPVAGREVADLLGEVGVEAIGEGVDEVPVDASPQVGEVGDACRGR